MNKYSLNLQGVLHVGAHECEEIKYYEKYIGRDKILWIEAMPETEFTDYNWGDAFLY